MREIQMLRKNENSNLSWTYKNMHMQKTEGKCQRAWGRDSLTPRITRDFSFLFNFLVLLSGRNNSYSVTVVQGWTNTIVTEQTTQKQTHRSKERICDTASHWGDGRSLSMRECKKWCQNNGFSRRNKMKVDLNILDLRIRCEKPNFKNC